VTAAMKSLRAWGGVGLEVGFVHKVVTDFYKERWLWRMSIIYILLGN
jgi:hypothetical protein